MKNRNPRKSGVARTASEEVQGEGDYKAARRYRDGLAKYLNSADVDKAAREAAPHDKDEVKAMTEAEEIGRSHAKASVPRSRS